MDHSVERSVQYDRIAIELVLEIHHVSHYYHCAGITVLDHSALEVDSPFSRWTVHYQNK